MKRIEILLRWLPLFLIVVIMLSIFLWEENLPISSSSHTLLEIGILVSFGLIVNNWISHHQENFIVSNKSLGKMERKCSQKSIPGIHAEDKND